MNIYYEKEQSICSKKGIYEAHFEEIPVRISPLEKLADMLVLLLSGVLSFLCSVKVRRILRASLTVACLIGILCLVAAMEAGALGLLPGAFLGGTLTAAEFFCLRSTSAKEKKKC